MLKLLRSFVAAKPALDASVAGSTSLPPAKISAPGVEDFDVVAHLIDANGLPVVQWAAAEAWVAGIADKDAQGVAWTACELAWLEHLRGALGEAYRLSHQGSVALLSSLDANVASATLAFVGKTLQRVVRP